MTNLASMPSITVLEIPHFTGEDEPDTDKDLIALYLSKTRGWTVEESLEQADFYRIATRDEFYSSSEECDIEIDRCIQAWIYTPMEVYLITRL